MGAITQAIKPGATFGSILGGALIGAAAGMIGAGVGNVVAGGSLFGSQLVTTIGFGSGFVSGFAGGFTSGFVGTAGYAWMGGANFGQGLGAGLKAGLIGGAVGGMVDGVVSGIRAASHGGDFFSGKGATFESIAAQAQPIQIGDELEYSNEYANNFSREYFGEVDSVNKLSADYSHPTGKGYYYKNDVLYNKNKDIVNAVTEYIGRGKSNVYLSPSAFSSKSQLFRTIGHEYIHATQNSFMSLKMLKATFKGVPMTEIAAYNWESSLGFNNGYQIWNGRLAQYSWNLSPYYNWLPRILPKF